MKELYTIIAVISACITMQAQTVLHITDQDGNDRSWNNVTDVEIRKDTASITFLEKGHKGGADTTVTLHTTYPNAVSMKVKNDTREIELDKTDATVYIGLYPRNTMSRMSQRQTSKSVKLVAKYKDTDETVENVRWDSSNPTAVSVSADGDVYAYYLGAATITATADNGAKATCEIHVAEPSDPSPTGSNNPWAYRFFCGQSSPTYEDLYHHCYATNIGISNRSIGEACNKDYTFHGNYYNYDIADVDLNKDAKGDYIYAGIEFDKNDKYSGSPQGNYITNVIAIYGGDLRQYTGYALPGKLDGCTYYLAKSLRYSSSQESNTDLNAGAGGRFIYLAYTKDPYTRYDVNGNPEKLQRYLVNHSSRGLYFNDPSFFDHPIDAITATNSSRNNINITRMLRESSFRKEWSESSNACNLGVDDELVMAYEYNLENATFTKVETADFNSEAGGSDIGMVCTYEPWYPQGNEWMKYVDDNTPVNRMSIPGTHDAITKEISFMSWAARDQSLLVEDQFDQGVRCFDLRLGGYTDLDEEGKGVRLIHGFDYYPMTSDRDYDEILKIFKGKIEAHPSEFIILCEQQDGDKQVKPFQEASKLEISILGDKLLEFRPGLTLKDCRGKILILHSTDFYFSIMQKPFNKFKDNGFDWFTGNASVEKDPYAPAYFDRAGVAMGKNNIIVSTDSLQMAPLWSFCDPEPGYFEGFIFKNEELFDGGHDPANRLRRCCNLLTDFSRLPDTDPTWCLSQVSGYYMSKSLVGRLGACVVKIFKKDTDIDKSDILDGLYSGVQAEHVNTRLADYIEGMDGRPCGIIQMDFAGTNDFQQNSYVCETAGYKLCQAIIRNNFKNRELIDGQYTYPSVKGTKDMPVRRIKLSEHEYTLPVGDSLSLTAAIMPTCSKWTETTWASDNEDIAYINEDNHIVAKQAGKAKITVLSNQYPEIKDSCLITVVPIQGEDSQGRPWIQLWKDGPRYAAYNVGANETYSTEHLDEIGDTCTVTLPQDAANLYGETDIATGKWGKEWRMMTYTEAKNLLSNTTTDDSSYDDGSTAVDFIGADSYKDNRITLPQGKTTRAFKYFTSTIDSKNPDQIYALDISSKSLSSVKTTDSCLVRPVYIGNEFFLPASKITLSRNSMSMPINGTTQLTAKYQPDNASQRITRWESSDPAVVTVDGFGNVTGKKLGTAIIRALATDESGKTDSCVVKVINAEGECFYNSDYDHSIHWVQLWDGGPRFLAEDLSENPSDPNEAPKTFTWGNDSEDADAVNEPLYGTDNDNVSKAMSSNVFRMMTKEEASMLLKRCTLKKVSDGYDIVGKGAFKDMSLHFSDAYCSWTSTNSETDINKAYAMSLDNNTVVEMDRKEALHIRGVFIGDPGNETTIQYSVDSIKIHFTESSILQDDSIRISAQVFPSTASQKIIKWTSSDTDVATIDSYGNIKAKGGGMTIITAAAVDGSNVSDTIHFTVIPIRGEGEIEGSTVKCPWVQLWVNGPRFATKNVGEETEDGNTTLFKWNSLKDDDTPEDASLYGKTDLATANWGPNWRMMTADEARQLFNYLGEDYHYRFIGQGKFSNNYLDLCSTNASTDNDYFEIFLNSTDNVDSIEALYHPGGRMSDKWSIIQKPKDTEGFVCPVYIGDDVKVPVKSINIAYNALEVKKGSYRRLITQVIPSTASQKLLDWSSSDPSVATVNGLGYIVGKDAGTATITVKATDGSGQEATCEVTVTK